MKNLIFIFLLLLTSQSLKASECYNYHTLKIYKIIVKSNGVYHQFTEKDPNGFSYVRQVNRLLKGIDRASYKAIGEDENTFMFADKNGFYLMPKHEQYEDNTAIFSKILSPSANQKHINGRLFLINGKWTYFTAWGKDINKVVLNELPENIKNIKSYSYGLYVKNDKQVFVISIDLNTEKKYKITTVPNLNPLKMVYYACNPSQSEDYIADEQHIFSIRREGTFTDVTPQFRALHVQGKFNALKLIDADIPMWRDGVKILKKRYGHSVSGKDPYTKEEIDIYYNYVTCIPLMQASGKTSYILFNNRIYPIWDENFSVAYQINTDVKKLKPIDDKLFRGNYFYYFESDDFKIISTNISANAKFFPRVYSYGNYLLGALVDEKYIHFIGDRFDAKLNNKKELTSKTVKQLGMFYLFNNALYDGKKSYPIIADEGTLSYLGSFVDVINECAGDMPNSGQVEIKYHHFFKDKDVVYYFDEKAKKLQTIQTADPTSFNTNDYEAFKVLYKIKDVKGTIKKKTNAALNYEIIAGAAFAILALGLIIYKRKKNIKFRTCFK